MPTTNHPFELPKLRATIKAGPDNPYSEDNLFWDVKFYPHETAADAPPIFAIVNQTNILICRICSPSSSEDTEGGNNNIISLIQTLATTPNENDPEATDNLNSCCWGYIDQSYPLLIAAGDSGLLKVFNVLEGTLLTTLVGHGRGTVNDVATHPIYPWIVASSSMDASVRIWDLRRWNNKHESPCVIICGHNNGHKEGILTVSWHDCGRYIVTGGHDHRICIWALPDLSPESKFWEEISPGQRKRSADEIRIVYYPHFVSSAVHSNYVDCARFFGDDVISKAAEEHKAVLWRVTGFNSRGPVPDATLAPKTEEFLETRNGFMRMIKTGDNGVSSIQLNPAYKSEPPYKRLLEFEAPNCESFYIRMGMLYPSPAYPDLHPILCLGNNASQVFFWDLERLEVGHDGGLRDHIGQDKFRKPAATSKKKGIARPSDRMSRFTSTTRDTGTASSPTPSTNRSSSVGTFDQPVPPYVPPGPTRFPSLAASPLIPAQSLGVNAALRQPSTDATSEIVSTIETPGPDRTLYPLHDPHRPLKSHAAITLADYSARYNPFTARAADWSRCGKWCVVAGQASENGAGLGVAVVFGRW